MLLLRPTKSLLWTALIHSSVFTVLYHALIM